MAPAAEHSDASAGLCWECGYSLRGLETPRCPECGRGFDPNDPETVNVDTHVGPVVKWLMKPPGWPTFLLVGVAAVLSLWAAATPMPSGHVVLIMWRLPDRLADATSPYAVLTDVHNVEVRIAWAVMAWAVVLAVWVPRRVARGVTVMRVSRRKAAPFAYWRRWLIPLCALGATVLVCRTPGPVYLGFWLSKPGLDRMERRQREGNPGSALKDTVGIYPYRPSGGWLRYHGRPGLVHLSQWGGFIYSPDVSPETGYDGSNFRYRYMGAGWYSFERKMP